MKNSIKTLLISSLILLVNSTVVSAAEPTSNQVKPSGSSARIERIESISKDRRSNPNAPAQPRFQRFPGATPVRELPLAPLPPRSRLPIDLQKNVQPSNSKN